MQRCLELAAAGLGKVQPNPMVGAVIVRNGSIIGEGFHTVLGGPHAEVSAVQSVADKSLLTESSLYVNLEPCNHYGRTPPCTDLILESGIPEVVIAQGDPNPKVAGSGITRLINAGVKVTRGILEQEARYLNRRFNLFHEQKRPWIILKWAQTADGFVDRIRQEESLEAPSWITDEICRALVHHWRAEEQAILIGHHTLLLDNPKLNVRLCKGKDPVRMVVGRIESGVGRLHLLDGKQPTLVFSDSIGKGDHNLDWVTLNFGKPIWPQVFDELYKREIQSVIVEGGPVTLNSLIRGNLWDEARVFSGPLKFGNGIKAPDFQFIPHEQKTIGNSTLKTYYRNLS